MYTVLGDIFRKGDSASNIGNAILYECICCISYIFPNSKMLDAAAETTSKFLKVFTFFRAEQMASIIALLHWKLMLTFPLLFAE
jgi:hypothetical protein